MQTASSILQYVGIFAIPVGLATGVVVILYVDALRLHSMEQRVMATYLANREAEEKARAKRRQRPVVVARARDETIPSPVTPPGFIRTQDGTLIRRAA